MSVAAVEVDAGSGSTYKRDIVSVLTVGGDPSTIRFGEDGGSHCVLRELSVQLIVCRFVCFQSARIGRDGVVEERFVEEQ